MSEKKVVRVRKGEARAGRRRRAVDHTAKEEPKKAEAKPQAKPQQAKPRKGKAPRRSYGKPKTSIAGLEALAKMDKGALSQALLGAAPARTYRSGDKVTGVVIGGNDDTLFVDLGSRASAEIPKNQIEATIGDEVTAFVVHQDDHRVLLTARLGGGVMDDELETASEQDIPVEGKITGTNKGGYEVLVGSTRAFVPFRLMSRTPIVDPSVLVGQTMTFMVEETGDRTVLSRRAIEEAESAKAAEAFWASAQEGQVVDAIVVNVHGWGAFLDIGGLQGLLPTREFGWDNVPDLTRALQPGTPLRVRIIKMDHTARKVTLSTRDPELDPWSTVGRDFVEGGRYKAEVVRVADFGAFVQLAPGLDGLVHSRHFNGRIPNKGTELDLRLRRIDAERGRLDLAPWDANAEDAEPQERVEIPKDTGSMGTFGDLFKRR